MAAERDNSIDAPCEKVADMSRHSLVSMTQGHLKVPFRFPSCTACLKFELVQMKAAVAAWSAAFGPRPQQVLQRRCILCVASLFLCTRLRWCDCLAVEPSHPCKSLSPQRLVNRLQCRACDGAARIHLWYACCGVARSATWLHRPPKHWLPDPRFERRHRLLTQTCLHLMPLLVTS